MVVCPACGEENPDRARFCLNCGTPVGPSVGGEERKVVSVLYVDIVGFTASADRADPEDVRAALRPYHERVRADIERFGGTVEKFVGDGVIAAFGAPVAHEDDPERAVRSALRILQTIEGLRAEGRQLAVRLAVTTGEAVVSLGARIERGEGIVTGDVVNVAARLQAAAQPGSVIVDEATMRATADAIDYEPLQAVRAKGKAVPIAAWRAKGARSRFGVDWELLEHAAFVGREPELSVLTGFFSRAAGDRSVHVVTIVGEPGIGKSRLVWELHRELDARPDLVTWRQGRCLPYGEGNAFWALGEIVKAEAGILESDSPAEADAKIVRAVAATIDDEAEQAWFIDRLAPLVGAREDVSGAGREEAFSAWRRYLEALAMQGPLVLVFEDLHWADSALLAFLEHLLDQSAAVPLLVVGTARPELYDARPDWGGGRRNSTTVGLTPLSDEDTARLVAALLDRAVLDADTQSSLIERSGGNPLYTEQFVRMLVEAGTEAEVPVPENVQALITARLDALPPELKALLHDASVVGKVFWAGSLTAIGGGDRDRVLAGVGELVRRELVRPARLSSIEDEEELSFWHVLVRDVAYQQIPRGPKARKHVAAAEWLERAAEDRISDQAEILVHHYEQALELAEAAGETDVVATVEPRLVHFLVLAGDRAMRLDIAAAEATYRRALALAGDGVLRARVLVKLGDAVQEREGLVEAEQFYDEALPTLREAGDAHMTGMALLGLSRALWRRGDTARAREVVGEAIPLLEQEPGPDLILAYERIASVVVFGGKQQEALEWVDKGIAAARELGVENIGRHLQMKGIARIGLGDLDGMDDLREGLDLSVRLGLAIEAAAAYNNLGDMVATFEDLPSGLALVDASRDLARRRGLVPQVMWARTTRLWDLYELGEWDELLAEADEILRWDREQGGTQVGVYGLMVLAPVHAQRGRMEDAAREIETFVPRARAINDPQSLQPALIQGALASAMIGRLEEGCSLVREYERVTRGDAPQWRAVALAKVVPVCVAAGQRTLAEKLLASVADAPRRQSILYGIATARAVLLEDAGEEAAAADHYSEALDAATSWGSQLGRANSLLGLGRCDADVEAAREGEAIFERLRAVPFTAAARAA
jgi:class 3 adenylate cyclase/tetratricopeptide (TPR) repeat protein